MTDDPWKALEAGGIDARRVDPNGKCDFFWVKSGNGEPGLLLRVAPGLEEPKLPRMRSLDIWFRDVAGDRALVLILKDSEQRELFATLCIDVVRAAEAATETDDTLKRAIRRILRWHHMLRGGQSDLLSLEEQRGLVGELDFLHRLIGLIGAYPAIEAWKGPAGSSKDFELDRRLVEVKARRGAAKPYVQISSEDQLADVDGCRLFLVVSAVDAAIKPNGKTLTDHVGELEKLYAAAEPDAYQLWELAIADAGFNFDDDYSDRRWTVGKTNQFEVLEGFPRIDLPLQTGVSGVRYSIALDACSPCAINPDVLDATICEGMDEWTN